MKPTSPINAGDDMPTVKYSTPESVTVTILSSTTSIDQPVDFVKKSVPRDSSTELTLLRSDSNAEVEIEAFETRRKWYANPKFALTIGVLEITLLLYTLTSINVIEGQFFRFGPPIHLFQYEINGKAEFAGILFIVFLHQLVFTWLSEVVQPWIMNEVQDPSVKHLSFSKPQTIVLINIYYIYFSLNSVIVVNVSLSQLSFLCVMIVADFIATTSLNIHYVWNKKSPLPLIRGNLLQKITTSINFHRDMSQNINLENGIGGR